MRIIIPRDKPPTWAERKAGVPSRWARPFIALEWVFDWVAYRLSQWKLLEVLEYLSSLSILVAAIFYFSEAGDRTKQKHYQAWQVINTAQGKGGSGGRLEAMQELNADHVPLVGRHTWLRDNCAYQRVLLLRIVRREIHIVGRLLRGENIEQRRRSVLITVELRPAHPLGIQQDPGGVLRDLHQR